jgi:hypothetical protein
MKTSADDVLEHLQQHEEAIADIYEVFSDRLRSMAAFWTHLVAEEKSHAMVITMIRKAIGTNNIKLDTHKFKTAAVQTAIDFICRQAVQVRDQGITPMKALALAIDLERAMIERDFFCVFESDSPVIRKEFTALREHTLAHQRMLQHMFDNEKRKQYA